MEKTLNILIVDDEPLIRMGIKFTLLSHAPSYKVVAEAGDAASAQAILQGKQPIDLVLLDIGLPDKNGVEVARMVHEYRPEARILIISVESNLGIIQELLEVGIEGFISKQSADEELISAISSIVDGFEYYGADTSQLIQIINNATLWKKPDFTDRELEIIALCAERLPVKAIAEKLCLSPRTIECHKHNIFKKMGFNTTADMVCYAYHHGLVKL